MDTLTKKQRQIFGYITKTNNAGLGPTLREIARAVKCRAHSTVFYHIKELEKKGYINKSPLKKGGITAINRPEPENVVPLLKRNIKGDWFNIENTAEFYNLSPGIIRADPKAKIILFRAWDNSMFNADKEGIQEGYLCFFIENKYPLDGDIVLVSIKNTLIIRWVRKKSLGGWVLKPENLKYKEIELKEFNSSLVFIGTLKAVLLNY